MRIRNDVHHLRKIDEYELAISHKDVVRRQIAVCLALHCQQLHGVHDLVEIVAEFATIRALLRQPRRSDTARADELHQDFGAIDLNWVRDDNATAPEVRKRGELCHRPLTGQHLKAVFRPVRHRPLISASAGDSALEVAGVSMKVPVLAVAISLRCKYTGCTLRYSPLDQVNVSLFSRLQDA